MNFNSYQCANSYVFCGSCNKVVHIMDDDEYCYCGNMFQPLSDDQIQELEEDLFIPQLHGEMQASFIEETQGLHQPYEDYDEEISNIGFPLSVAAPMTYQLSVPCPEDPAAVKHWNSVLKSRQENATNGRDYYKEYLVACEKKTIDESMSRYTSQDDVDTVYPITLETIHPVTPVTPVTEFVPEITTEMQQDAQDIFASVFSFHTSSRAQKIRHQFAKLGLLRKEYINDELFEDTAK